MSETPFRISIPEFRDYLDPGTTFRLTEPTGEKGGQCKVLGWDGSKCRFSGPAGENTMFLAGMRVRMLDEGGDEGQPLSFDIADKNYPDNILATITLE